MKAATHDLAWFSERAKDFATQQPEADLFAIQSLATWLVNLLHVRLPRCRDTAAVPTWEATLGILTELTRDGYHRKTYLWPAAEIWILRRPWTYKSPKRVVLADFFPTPDMVGEMPPSILMAVHTKAVDDAYRRGYADGHRAAENRTLPPSPEQRAGKERARSELLAAFRDRYELVSRVDELTAERDRLLKTIERLTKQLRQSEQGSS